MQIFERFRLLWRERFQKRAKRILAQKWFDVGLQGKMSAFVTVGLTGIIAIFSYLAITTTRQTTQQLLHEHAFQARILAENMELKYQSRCRDAHGIIFTNKHGRSPFQP